MKEKITTVNDDPQFKEVSDSVTRCQLELLKVGERSAQVELEILNIKTTSRKMTANGISSSQAA